MKTMMKRMLCLLTACLLCGVFLFSCGPEKPAPTPGGDSGTEGPAPTPEQPDDSTSGKDWTKNY